jgi:hypothetical protein
MRRIRLTTNLLIQSKRFPDDSLAEQCPLNSLLKIRKTVIFGLFFRFYGFLFPQISTSGGQNEEKHPTGEAQGEKVSI